MSTEQITIETTNADGKTVPITVDREHIKFMVTIANMLEDIPEGCGNIPCPSVSAETMRDVVRFAQICIDNPRGDEYDSKKAEMEPFEKAYIDEINTRQNGQKQLFDIILAANFLDFKFLLDCTCRGVAQMIKGKTPDEIKETFKIQDSSSTSSGSAGAGAGASAGAGAGAGAEEEPL